MNNGGRGLCILARPVRCVSYRRRAPRARSPLLFCALFLVPLLGASCSRMGGKPPSIEFTSVPPADRGGPDFMDTIAGRVKGAKPGQKIVIFTHNNVWWVQPGKSEPYTPIKSDSTWSASTHVGMEYAALLVDPGYHPPAAMDVLPAVGAGVVAIATVPGDPSKHMQRHVVQFSGYDWVARAAPSDRGGKCDYDPSNVWTDEKGALHLRISGTPGAWKCAEVSLTSSLGYGTYVFVMQDVSKLEPAAVSAIFTWDGPAEKENHREFDIEVSRWGEHARENARYAIQPYYLAGNVARFVIPAGSFAHSIRWEAGRIQFKTVRSNNISLRGPSLAEHSFQSGVPSPGNERVRLSVYAFQRGPRPLQKGAEIVVEKFQYFP
jgi:hypothetical protein